MDPAALDQPPLTPDVPFHWEPRPKFQDRVWLHVLLLVLTIVSTTYLGVEHYLAFIADYAPLRRLPMPIPQLLIRGLWYSGTALAILGCHELGHYFACRYYDVDASLPFFIPAPTLFGTLGAFIRIREPIPTKRMLFDIGIAGPIAGFLVTIPALFMGVAMSHVVRVPPNLVGFNLGEPLLFKLAQNLLWGPIPDGFSLNMHPMAFAAWFGLLATALNLFPVGQLDGGHISYAVLGRRSTYVTLRHGPRRHRPRVFLQQLDLLDRLDGPHAVHVRPGASPGFRRARAARSHPFHSGSRRARDVRALFHARADRTHGAASQVNPGFEDLRM